ncbi:cytochrome B [Pseudomonas putida]|uniref:Cytochrome B n=1 Tax=Pseudomonas putida TaxID=303 RepID=A0A2Z4RWF9_PSEPU|nr:cytochrome b/b6 domain-containing protein [Pseudomonas putida]AWY44134.1 cytochrome B [Pseudomonas putida]
MSHSKYTKAQVALHWLSAFIILWSLCTGSYVALFKASPDIKSLITALNISMTTLFIPFFVLRAILRINHLRKYPAGPGELLATFVHNLIYLITAMVLLTGVLMMDRPISVFGLPSLPPLITNPQWLHDFHAAHRDSTEMLGGLVLLHLLAVAKHELSGNRILKNMSFQSSSWEAPTVAPAPVSVAQPIPMFGDSPFDRRRVPRH